MKDEHKYLFDKQLSRFDFYINTVNTKAAFIITFNTFIIGTILFKYDVIIEMFCNQKIKTIVIAVIILLVVTIGLSLWNVFAAVRPFLNSGNTPLTYHSLLFFKSVSEMSNADYEQAVNKLDDQLLFKDLIAQTYTIAKGATLKFEKINNSMFWLLYFVVIPIALIFALRILDWIVS